MMSKALYQAAMEASASEWYQNEATVYQNEAIVLDLEDFADRLNHVQVRQLLGLPRAERFQGND